jgi:hypothetical protein
MNDSLVYDLGQLQRQDDSDCGLAEKTAVGTRRKETKRRLKKGTADVPEGWAISFRDPGCVKTLAAGQGKQW